MQQLKHVDMREWHSFASPSIADELLIIENDAEIGAMKADDIVLGSGSNVILAEHIKQRLVKLNLKGIKISAENGDEIRLRVAAGEQWGDFVHYCVENGWYGVENLTAIPGTVGAAPVQNIGAYGVEVADVIEYIEIYDLIEQGIKRLALEDLKFSYRQSILKQQNYQHWVVISVDFRLKKKGALNLDYGPLQSLQGQVDSLKTLYDAITKIRWSKLPRPVDLANAGSFFHNPVINRSQLPALLKINEEMPHYAVGQHNVKIPAAWLIESLGLKGYQQGKVGIYDKHALIVVNRGATGSEIIQFSHFIRDRVFDHYAVVLQREPIVIGEIHGA